MSDFFRTRMGVTFFERTLPDLVRQLTRIADLLERLADAEEDRDPDKRETKEDG